MDKKMTEKEYKEWVKKLAPYWHMREEAYSKFRQAEMEIEKKMNKELKPDVELEFWYNDDGGLGGIGAANWEDREKFPLIYDMDLMEE